MMSKKIINASSDALRPVNNVTSSVELLPSKPYSASFTPSTHVIGFAFDTQSGVHAFGSDQRRRYRRQAHSFAFIPAGCDVYSASDKGGEYLKINIAPELLSHTDLDRPLSQVVIAQSIGVTRELRKRLMMEYPIEALLVEKLIDDLIPKLALKIQTKNRILTPRQLKTLDEFIDANIDQNLSVIDMAKSIHVSEGHFSRLFKRSVGVSPFDYVIQRRLAHARYLLSQSGGDLSDIAYRSGFCSHAHMSMVFRKHLGISPRVLRDRFH